MKNSKKIALFLPSLRGGGAEKVFVNLANEFVKRGFYVDLILVQKEGPYLKDVSDKVNIIDLKSKRILFSLFPLIRYFKQENPEVLISAISHANSIALLAEIFVQNEVGIIVTEHSYFSMAQNKTPFLKRVIMKFLVKILYKRAKAVIVVSRKAANNLTRKIGVRKDSLHVIYNPIDIESISEKSKEEPQHDWLNNKKYPVILGAGRLTMPKDFSTLIKAFNCLRKKRRAKLIILGEGGKRKELEKLIRELNLQSDVDMPGFVSNPYSYMSKSDVFVLSSKYEGFGNVLVEAMACGVSVVSTNCPGGPAEILENGKYGKLVSVGDVNALAMVILETLNNSTEKEVLKERARFFSLEKAVNKYLELINE